jgi:4-hydroxy-2-oxoheptanedioate aldolase
VTPARRSLKQRLASGEDLVGALVRMPAEEIVEMLAVAGHDFVLIDCEHGSDDLGDLRRHVTAAESFGLPVLARCGSGDTAFLLRALDLGVEGIVAPHVESADAAAGLVRAVRYPPHGDRGFAAYSRVGRYGSLTREEHLRRAEEVLLVVMIESPAAVRVTPAITEVDGVDGFLIGTSDLGASRTESDPSLDELVATTRATASPSSVRFDLAGSANDARTALASGARVIVHNLTLEMIGLFRELRV